MNASIEFFSSYKISEKAEQEVKNAMARVKDEIAKSMKLLSQCHNALEDAPTTPPPATSVPAKPATSSMGALSPKEFMQYLDLLAGYYYALTMPQLMNSVPAEPAAASEYKSKEFREYSAILAGQHYVQFMPQLITPVSAESAASSSKRANNIIGSIEHLLSLAQQQLKDYNTTKPQLMPSMPATPESLLNLRLNSIKEFIDSIHLVVQCHNVLMPKLITPMPAAPAPPSRGASNSNEPKESMVGAAQKTLPPQGSEPEALALLKKGPFVLDALAPLGGPRSLPEVNAPATLSGRKISCEPPQTSALSATPASEATPNSEPSSREVNAPNAEELLHNQTNRSNR